MTKPRLNIAILRPFGANVGNHVINTCLVYLLNKTFGKDTLNIIDIPASRKIDSGILAGLDRNTTFYLNEIADGVIIGGGNLFENGEIDAEPVALNALQPPLMLFSNSLGRIVGRSGALIQRTDSSNPTTLWNLHSKAVIKLSRDSATVDLLANYDCQSQLGYCPTIHTRLAYEDRIKEVERCNRTYISIRNPDRISGTNYQKYLVTNSIDTIIQKAIMDQPEELVILCNDLRDLQYAMYLNARYGLKYEYTGKDYEFIAKLSSAKLVYSYRLHTTVPCVSLGTKVINISYDERAKCLSENLGLNKYSVSVNDHHPSNIYDKIEEKVIKSKPTVPESWAKISQLQSDYMTQFSKLVMQYNGML